MRIDESMFLAALRSPEVLYPVKWKPASEIFLKWLEEHQVPEPLVEFYKRLTPQKYAQLGMMGLETEKRVMAENRRHSQFLKTGLLIVGSASNGDFVVIDIAHGDGIVGYVSHEELWQAGGQRDDVRSIFRWVSPSLGTFALGVVKNTLPVDYYWSWFNDEA